MGNRKVGSLKECCAGLTIELLADKELFCFLQKKKNRKQKEREERRDQRLEVIGEEQGWARDAAKRIFTASPLYVTAPFILAAPHISQVNRTRRSHGSRYVDNAAAFALVIV